MTAVTWVDELEEAAPGRVADALAAVRRTRYYDEAGGDVRFALWLANVDRRMTRMVGVGYRDIADWGWRDAYDAGTSPKDAAVEALDADDLPWLEEE